MIPAASVATEALLPAAMVALDPVEAGHINTTLRVRCSDGSHWCLQRLNPVFADERLVMANVEMVVSQLRRAGHATIDLAVDHSGKPWFVDDEGATWRAYRWIQGDAAVEHPRPDWLALARHVGSYAAALVDLDDSQVVTVVDRFHDPADRWRRLEQAVADDAVGRVALCADELDQVRRLGERIWAETPAAGWANLPRQVVHNDTKLANIIVGVDGQPLALVDLDTTMMGSPLNDLGEFVRGHPGLQHTDDGELLARLALAFVEALARPLTAPEWDGLASAGAVMSFENAVRALTDHLDGDRYYDLGAGMNLGRFQRHAARTDVLLDLAPTAAAALARHDSPSPGPR